MCEVKISAFGRESSRRLENAALLARRCGLGLGFRAWGLRLAHYKQKPTKPPRRPCELAELHAGPLAHAFARDGACWSWVLCLGRFNEIGASTIRMGDCGYMSCILMYYTVLVYYSKLNSMLQHIIALTVCCSTSSYIVKTIMAYVY